jgi:inosine-uridine nucleoside N-ribohydrolase
MEARIGQTCPRLPEDIVNFLHDPLACAIALGWSEGVTIDDVPLTVEIKDGWLVQRVDDSGQRTRVVTRVDGNNFSEFWLNTLLTR